MKIVFRFDSWNYHYIFIYQQKKERKTIMRNDLRISTANGIVELDNCKVLKVRESLVYLRWMPTKLFIRDDELEKLENIIQTQLMCGREFYVSEEKDYIDFTYPVLGVKSFIRTQKCGRFDESI